MNKLIPAIIVLVFLFGSFKVYSNSTSNVHLVLSTCEVLSGYSANAYSDVSNEGLISSDLSWDVVPSGDFYQVNYMGPDPGTVSTEVLSSPEITLTHLSANTTYSWRVRVQCNGVWSPWPSVWQTFEASEEEYTDQTNPDGIQITDLDYNIVSLRWNDNTPDETGFSIERSDNATSGFVEVGTSGVDVTTFHDTGLTPNTTYFYRVRALGSGAFDYSDVFEVTTSEVVAADTEITHKPRYNGAITAIKWKNFGDEEQKLFTYHYDPAQRLTAAQFARGQTNPSSVWSTTAAGGFSVPGISYDPNGNITALQRQDDEGGARTIDALTYAYTGNRLMAVTDPVSWGGFADKNTEGNDYEYDDNGNLIRDENQGITAITYNHMDLPERIDKNTGEYILYTYDASGAKLSEELYDAAGELVKRTDYMGEFVFEDGELKLIHHEEGRIVPDKTDGTYAYHYDLRDHLGNSRVTVSSKPQTLVFTLNYENDEGLPDDIALFEGTEPIVSSEFMDHTDQQEGTEAQNLYSHSQLLNAGEGNRLGSVIALPVMQGDQVTAEVFAKYINPSSPTNVGTVTGLGASLIAAFTGSGALTTEMGNSITNNFTGTNGSLIGTAGFDYEDAAAPKAFLNVMFLPEDDLVSLDATSFAFDQIAASAEQLQGAGATNAPFDRLTVEDFEAPAKGYVIVYLSNESETHIDVHFDDFSITLNQMEMVQSQDYYPFGLTFNGYERTGLDKNEYLYQGKEELEGTDWTDFHARNYHAALGRFMQTDPLYNGPSGYVGMLNNPISTTDPDGRDPVTISVGLAVAIGAAVSAVSYTASVALSDGGFNNWDWGQFTQGVTIGAFSGAVTWGIGTEFGVAIKSATGSKVEVLKAAKIATHATYQGGLSAAQGGDFLSAFASAAVGGAVGLGTDQIKGVGGNIASVGSAMLLGGVAADLSGGEFWKGAAVAGIVAGANDVAHRLALGKPELTSEDRKRMGAAFRARMAKLQQLSNPIQDGGDPTSYKINQVLRLHGFGTRESQLFPSMSGLDLSRRIISYIRAVFDPGPTAAVPVALASEISTDFFTNKTLDNADLSNLLVYRESLLSISNTLNSQISNMKKVIETLRSTNSTRLHNQEIISRTRHMWDLQNQLVPVNQELIEINARVSKGFIDK